jgi:hypothetical protein
VGAMEGVALGFAVGGRDGAALGSSDGDALGFFVGGRDGAALGLRDGDALGLKVGARDGLAVGAEVGGGGRTVNCSDSSSDVRMVATSLRERCILYLPG